MRIVLISLWTIPLVLGCGDTAKDDDDDDEGWGEEDPDAGGWGTGGGAPGGESTGGETDAGGDTAGSDGGTGMCDALDNEPQTSYCEAVCDWAVTCADGISSWSADEMMTGCLEVTRASDAACEAAERGDLTVEQSLILSECTDAVADMACSGITGSETDVASGRPPELMCIGGYGGVDDVSSVDLSDPTVLAEIGPYQTYNDARNLVLKTGEEFCDSVAKSICDALTGCVADTDATDTDPVDLLMEECLSAFDAFNGQCKAIGLYDQTLPLDLNPARWMADDCVTGMSEADACNVTGWPLECAVAFISVDGSNNLADLVFDSAMVFLDSK